MPVRVEKLSSEAMSDYEVVFSDGSVIQCHGAHEWYVYSRTRHRWCVLETREIEQEPIRDGSRYNFSVPRTRPLVASGMRLPLHPYVLGAWLGDGHSDRPEISHSGDDWEVVAAIDECGYPKSASWIQADTGVCYARFAGLKSGLEVLELFGNKHVPECYLQGSIEQRSELLAGLIDTDGSYSAQSGQYRFTNTNRNLIDGVAFLANSLGFKVGKIQEYAPTTSSSGIVGKKTVWVVAFSPTRTIPCRIPRKQAKRLSEPCRLAIADIRRCAPKLGRCIQVEGGLYLVGERLITTHNSWLGSVYFPAWILMLWPETRIALASYEEGFACKFGGQVKDVINEFGPDLGITLRDDTRAKGEWIIDGYGGGMVCKGRGGALVGRPVDLLILDDLIKNAEEAQSPTILESVWDWYQTVAYSRLGPSAPVIGIGTRWGPKDIFGHWIEEAKIGGDEFKFIIFKAIAESDDILGREPGQALWPERVPLERLQRVAKTRPRWFRACWQSSPQEDEGLHFQPRQWPRYSDVGDAWRVQAGYGWLHYRKVECAILIAVDWAQAGKKDSNKTAITVAALTPDGKILILKVYNKTLRYEENAPILASHCKGVRESLRAYLYNGYTEAIELIVASDDDMLSDAMYVECRSHKDIPDIKRLPIRSRAKIIRAQAAIIRSQNGQFLMPDLMPDWYEETCDQLSGFTGEEGAEDDVADTFGILGRLAQEYVPNEDQEEDYAALGDSGHSGMGFSTMGM